MSSYKTIFNETEFNGDSFEVEIGNISGTLYVNTIAPNGNASVTIDGMLQVNQDVLADKIVARSPGTNLTLQGNASLVQVDDNLDVTGNLTIQGTTSFYNSVTFNGGIVTDTVTAFSNNGNLFLAGNGTGLVQSLDNFKTPAIELTSTSDQIIIKPNDSGNFFNITADGNPSITRTLTLPDIADGTFIIDNGNQTITGDILISGDLASNSSIACNVYTAYGLNSNIDLIPNGTGFVSVYKDLSTLTGFSLITDTLRSNQITTRGTNQDLTITANGTGVVVVDDTFLTSQSLGVITQSSGDGSPDARTSTSIMARNSTPSNRVYYLPEVTTGADFVMTEGGQTINGTKLFDRIVSDEFIVSIGGSVFWSNSASFTTSIIADATTANRVYRLPETGATLNYFVMTQGAQFISGQKEFTTVTYFNNATPAIAFGTSTSGLSKTFINHVIPSADRTISIQDAGANSNFVLSEGAMTINGVKTLSGNNIHSGLNQFTNTTNSTSATTGALRVTGGAAINRNLYVGTTTNTDGIFFLNNTSPYTPTVLNYNEVSSFNVTFTCRGASSASIAIPFERRGRRVTIIVPAFTFTSGAGATSPNVIVATGLLPTRLRPTQAQVEVGYFSNTDLGVRNTGPILITSTGNIEIYKTVALANWNASQTVGLLFSVSITWIIS